MSGMSATNQPVYTGPLIGGGYGIILQDGTLIPAIDPNSAKVTVLNDNNRTTRKQDWSTPAPGAAQTVTSNQMSAIKQQAASDAANAAAKNGGSALQQFFDWYKSTFGGGSDGGAAAAAAAAQRAAIEAAVNKINEDYGRQVAAIGANRNTGADSIANALQTFHTNSMANNAQYNAAAQSIADAIAARSAQALQQSQDLQRQQAAQANALGWNGAAIQANSANNSQALQNSIRAQQDLADRFRQVQTNAQGQAQNAAELMHQGATGQLANNYQSAMNAAEKAKSDALYSAQHPTVSSSGGGGSGNSSSSQIRDMSTAYDLYQKMSGANNVDPISSLLGVMFKNGQVGVDALSNAALQPYLAGAARTATGK